MSKKFVFLCLAWSAVLLSGCAQESAEPAESEAPTEQQGMSALGDAEQPASTEGGEGIAETGEPDSPAQFPLTGDTIHAGNSSSAVSQGGFCYIADGYCLRVDGGQRLVEETTDGERVLAEEVFGGINCYGERIYYIGSADYHVYSMAMDGGDKKEELAETAYELLVCDYGIVYRDKSNQIRLRTLEGESCVLSSAPGIWLGYYGDWLIFTETRSDGSNPVVACQPDSGELVLLAEYGLFPDVEGDVLFYQGDAGAVSELSLTEGEARALTDTWGQGFALIDGLLFFTNGDKIYSLDSSDSLPEVVYEVEEGTLEQLWALGDVLIFTETVNGESSLKQYDPAAKEVSDYE